MRNEKDNELILPNGVISSFRKHVSRVVVSPPEIDQHHRCEKKIYDR